MISVIIPTFNAGKFLEKQFISLRSQTLPCEIIIVDSSSTDNTVKISKSFGAKVVSIEKEAFNHGRARNLGVARSEGDILVFMTQDAIPFDKYAFEKLIEPVEITSEDNSKNKIAASYGKQIPQESAKPTERFARLYNYHDTPLIKGMEDVKKMGIKAFFFSNAFSCVRRDIFEEINGFPENLLMFEDMLFAAKLMQRGYKIAYVPEAKIIHSHNYTCRQQFKRYFQAGVSFKKNGWFLELAISDKEGVKFLIEEIKYLIKHNAFHWLIYAVIEAIFKYSGYKLGVNYDKIPVLKTKFS